MKLCGLVVLKFYFKCAKFQNFTTCATWFFGASKSAIQAPKPNSRGYIYIQPTEASRGLTTDHALHDPWSDQMKDEANSTSLSYYCNICMVLLSKKL